jgi:tetratricopeptide (TPR) repeat protein
MGQTITQSELLSRIEREVSQPSGERCPCTLVLGSGFSHPVIPTTTTLVREDLPWFDWCQSGENGGPTPECFADETKRKDFADRARLKAQEFWQRIKNWADASIDQQRCKLAFSLGPDGYPDRDGISSAYMAALSPACPHGLSTDEMARRFLSSVIQRAGKRLNPAHLYLASLLSERSGIFRTIFTTNFDPLLQRSLQLVNVPYFVSDRPDVMQHPEDDDIIRALHLVHVHGSIYRYLLLNTPEVIESFAEQNQPLLQEYFRKHCVLIVGYGGWDDAISRALSNVRRFARNLYWCDLGATVEQSSISLAGRKLINSHPEAFYVQIEGADSLLIALHQRLVGHAMPKLFREPIEVLEEQYDQCDLSGMKLPKSATERSPNAKFDIPHDAGSLTITPALQSSQNDELDLGQQLQEIRARLQGAKSFMRGEIIEDTGNGEKHGARLRELMSKATDLYFGEKYYDTLSQANAILEFKTLSPADRALWLHRRGFIHDKLGLFEYAINDYTTAIGVPDAPPGQVAKSLFNRGVSHLATNKNNEALTDFTNAISHPGSTPERVTTAFFNRAVVLNMQKRHEEALADFTSAINVVGAPSDSVAGALIGRARLHISMNSAESAVADCDRVLNLPSVSAVHTATAFLTRGAANAACERWTEAVSNIEHALAMPGLAPDELADAQNLLVAVKKLDTWTEEKPSYRTPT